MDNGSHHLSEPSFISLLGGIANDGVLVVLGGVLLAAGNSKAEELDAVPQFKEMRHG